MFAAEFRGSAFAKARLRWAGCPGLLDAHSG
jgi:hypothetical protein